MGHRDVDQIQRSREELTMAELHDPHHAEDQRQRDADGGKDRAEQKLVEHYLKES
jgi:hypothetical protein